MKTGLVSVMCSTLLACAASYPADAHQAHTKRHVISKDFMADAPYKTAPAVLDRHCVLLDGPTHDATSTATGGPSGGIN